MSPLPPHARLYRSIWTDDEDFLALSPLAKVVYLYAFSGQKVSLIGSLDFSQRRWCRATGLTAPELDDALEELDRARFLLIDLETDEVIVRTYVIHDRAWPNRKMRQGIWNQWARIESPTLRRRILDELPAEMWDLAPDEARALVGDRHTTPPPAEEPPQIDPRSTQDRDENDPGSTPDRPGNLPTSHDPRPTSFVPSSVDEPTDTRGAPPPDPTTTDDDQATSPPGEPPAAPDELDPIEATAAAVCDLLGDRDHDRAVADGVRIRSKRRHRETCRATARRLHWGTALTLARAHQDLTPAELADLVAADTGPHPPPDPPQRPTRRHYPTPEEAAERRERAEAERPPALEPAELAARASAARRQLAHSA